jgi:hypothetical protein
MPCEKLTVQEYIDLFRVNPNAKGYPPNPDGSPPECECCAEAGTCNYCRAVLTGGPSIPNLVVTGGGSYIVGDDVREDGSSLRAYPGTYSIDGTYVYRSYLGGWQKQIGGGDCSASDNNCWIIRSESAFGGSIIKFEGNGPDGSGTWFLSTSADTNDYGVCEPTVTGWVLGTPWPPGITITGGPPTVRMNFPSGNPRDSCIDAGGFPTWTPWSPFNFTDCVFYEHLPAGSNCSDLAPLPIPGGLDFPGNDGIYRDQQSGLCCVDDCYPPAKVEDCTTKNNNCPS